MAEVKARLGTEVEPARASALVKAALAQGAQGPPRRGGAHRNVTAAIYWRRSVGHTFHRELIKEDGECAGQRTGNAELEIARRRRAARHPSEYCRGPYRRAAGQ